MACQAGRPSSHSWMLHAVRDKLCILKLRGILPWMWRSCLKEWTLTAPDSCVLALRALRSWEITPKVTQPTWEHVLAQDTLFLLQEASLSPGSFQNPFLLFCRVSCGRMGFLTLFSWFLCPSEPGYYREVVYISLHGIFVAISVRVWLQSLGQEYDQGHIFVLMKDIRYHLHCWLFSEKIRLIVSVFPMKTWEEFSNPGSVPVIS